jgi:ketosteroid isomerase-like protein
VNASKNLDLVRSIYADWERGDYSSAVWAHPEIEFVRPEGATAGSSTGLAGMAEGFRDFLSAWEDFRAGAEEFRELDDQLVLVLNYFSGRGKASGLQVERAQTKGASLFHVRDGKVVRLVIYANRALAFADLGLAPDSEAT